MPSASTHAWSRANLTEESVYANSWNFPRCFATASDPTSSDDETLGFWYGSFWSNTGTTNGIWVCTDPTTGAAVWGFLKF